MPNQIYLDNAAALPVLPTALQAFNAALTEHYANQEAIHGAAATTRKAMAVAATELVTSLGIKPERADVLWSDSGTSVLAMLLRHPRFHKGEIVLSGAEHPALAAAARRTGATIRLVRLEHGRIDLKHLEEILSPQTVLIAVHHVQSETGIVQDLNAVGNLVKTRSPQAFFLADTIQAAGKLDIPWESARLDGMVVAGFKVGTPGGAAAICRKTDGHNFITSLATLRNDEHMVSRPLPAACLALTAAVRELQAGREENYQLASKMNREFRAVLNDNFPVAVSFLQPFENTSPYILHFLLPGYQAAVLVRMMSAHGIFIAAGSACNAETPEPSPALLATGVNKKDAFSGLRISFGPQNTVKEARLAAEMLRQTVKEY